jgi:hypothetical protein
MDALITDILTGGTASPFDSYYSSAKSYFNNNDHFFELSANTCDGLAWPSNNGIYVVWRTTPMEEVLYIGMTGKFSKAGVMSGPGLKARTARWTPYCFDKTRNTFCFGPNPVQGENNLRKQQAAGYKHSVPISDIRVDCFEYFTTHKMAPALLEALLLQGYLMQHGQLPRANNKL